MRIKNAAGMFDRAGCNAIERDAFAVGKNGVLRFAGVHAAGPVPALGAEDGFAKRTAERPVFLAVDDDELPLRASVKIRYRSTAHPATISRLDESRVRVEFDQPLRDITPGQAAVFYEGDKCLGGGIIKDEG